MQHLLYDSCVRCYYRNDKNECIVMTLCDDITVNESAVLVRCFNALSQHKSMFRVRRRQCKDSTAKET